MPDLETIVQEIRDEWTEQNHVRDLTLQRSRMLIRLCANSIRATHRREYAEAQSLLDQQSEHMDCEGVAKLVRADRQREAVLLAPLAGPGEDHLPRVGADRLPDLGQP